MVAKAVNRTGANMKRSRSDKIRYAVVGLGHIAQAAVLPAFAHAGKNSELVALISGDAVKRRELAKRYGVSHTYDYQRYDECLQSGEVDAVYIALPNNLHCEYTVRAARAGVHVLCEKPMALSEQECRRMITAAEKHRVKLMIAYRLHFEEANLKAVELVQSGKLGEPRLFNSVFTFQVQENNIRLEQELGGGTLHDIGIYCINAVRYLFQDEPIEACAFTSSKSNGRFKEVDETASALLRFPQDRLATFTSSFGVSDMSMYEVVGTKGSLRVEPAYEYVGGLRHRVKINGKEQERTFPARDQFAPELVYFSDCILSNRQPEPNGMEGLLDVRVIEALYRSAGSGKIVKLKPMARRRRPKLEQEIHRPPVKEPKLVHTESPVAE
jgi:glucose-fructose oxidoreductase